MNLVHQMKIFLFLTFPKTKNRETKEKKNNNKQTKNKQKTNNKKIEIRNS